MGSYFTVARHRRDKENSLLSFIAKTQTELIFITPKTRKANMGVEDLTYGNLN